MVSPHRLKSVYKFVFAASMIAPQHNADSNSMHQELQKCMALTHKHKKRQMLVWIRLFFFFLILVKFEGRNNFKIKIKLHFFFLTFSSHYLFLPLLMQTYEWGSNSFILGCILSMHHLSLSAFISSFYTCLLSYVYWQPFSTGPLSIWQIVNNESLSGHSSPESLW